MERVHTLIAKLNELQQNSAPASLLLATAQLLVSELESSNKTDVKSKVTIMVPAYNKVEVSAAAMPKPVEEIPEGEKEYFALEGDNLIADWPEQALETQEPERETDEPEIQEPLIEETEVPKIEEPIAEEIKESVESQPAETPEQPQEIVTEEETHTEVYVEEPAEEPAPAIVQEERVSYEMPKPPTSIWHSDFESKMDIPTLPPQPEKKRESFELNDLIGNVNQENLNEKFRVEKIELGASFGGAPIKDLKKAIGINERYLYINELFRGDENMFERSIKTINSFNIYPEAQFWIQRELKTKLGWPDNNNTTVLQFDSLVKRRFS